MGYAVYRDLNGYRRFAGYGVPAICDHPECTEEIDRGLGYACGGGGYGGWDGACGLYFCHGHLTYSYGDDEDETDLAGGKQVCDVCDTNARREVAELDWLPTYDPKGDTVEWAQHVLSDESWAQFREEEPEWVKDYQDLVDNHKGERMNDRLGEKFFYTRDYPHEPQLGPEIFYGDPENHYKAIASLERAKVLATLMETDTETTARYGVSWGVESVNQYGN